MARTQTSTTHKKSKTKAKRRSSREPVAIALLKKQHAEVDKLFKRYSSPIGVLSLIRKEEKVPQESKLAKVRAIKSFTKRPLVVFMV